ncbi:MAG: hypothetical protein ABFS21_10135 [Actinomycetota bacterium]
MEERERTLSSIAREQRGVFTMAQALACGFPRTTIIGRAARGRYEPIHPGIFGMAGSEDSWLRRVMGSVLSVTSPAGASHRTAAFLWGMTSRRPETIEVVTPRHLRRKRHVIVVHESKDLVASDLVTIDDIPTTTAVRTIVDLGASAPPWFVERCLDTGLRKKLFTAWEVQCFIARVARPGRTGVGTIRPLVEERLAWDTITESDLEDLFRSVVSPLPFPMPEPQHRLFEPSGAFVGRFDFAYPQRSALIETDSEGWHMDPVSFQRDREKQNRAHALGWAVYRFTWRQLIDDPESVRAIITAIWTD